MGGIRREHITLTHTGGIMPTLRACGTKKFSQGVTSIHYYFNEGITNSITAVAGGDDVMYFLLLCVTLH